MSGCALGNLCIAATEISATVPSVGATSVCSIFMASMMARRCPSDDLRARLNQNMEHLAMHGCPHNPASVMIPSLIQSEVTQSDFGLPSVAQDIDGVAIGHDHGIFRRRTAFKQKL